MALFWPHMHVCTLTHTWNRRKNTGRGAKDWSFISTQRCHPTLNLRFPSCKEGGWTSQFSKIPSQPSLWSCLLGCCKLVPSAYFPLLSQPSILKGPACVFQNFSDSLQAWTASIGQEGTGRHALWICVGPGLLLWFFQLCCECRVTWESTQHEVGASHSPFSPFCYLFLFYLDAQTHLGPSSLHLPHLLKKAHHFF